MNMLQLFSPGDIIYGYCNGYFGRDDYEDKTCVVVTRKYAVFEYEDGSASVLNLRENFDSKMIQEWKDLWISLEALLQSTTFQANYFPCFSSTHFYPPA